MARIRTLKPEFWTDEKLALHPPLTRLVFLGFISQADDAGRLVDNVKLLDGLLFPYTDDTCADALADLAATGRILRYRSDSGQALIQITNWTKHQNVQKPSKYVLPAPSQVGECDFSGDFPETPRSVPVSDLRPTTPDLRPTTADPREDEPGPASQPRDGGGRHQAECVEFVKANGYGAREVLMAEGEDGPAWATHTGERVPWPDRLRLLKLAHARVVDRESPNLRSALRYVIPQQYDPTKAPTAEEFASRKRAAEQPVALPPVKATTATESKAANERRQQEYREWKDRTTERLNAEPPATLEALTAEAKNTIGEIVLRGMPHEAARKRALGEMALQLYGKKIGDPAPAPPMAA
jgi:hypothetical protein